MMGRFNGLRRPSHIGLGLDRGLLGNTPSGLQIVPAKTVPGFPDDPYNPGVEGGNLFDWDNFWIYVNQIY